MLSAANTLPLRIAAQCNVPVIIAHSHNDQVPSGIFRRFLHQKNVKQVTKYANNFFACSRNAGKWLFPNISQNKVTVIPNAIPVNNFLFNLQDRKNIRKKLKIDDSFVLGHVGRFQEQKNHSFLISVFYRFHLLNNKSKLLLIGEGELRNKIQKEMNDLGIEDSVIFLEPTQTIEKYYMAMDAFVFPSLFEGLGIAALEAQASGLQVIASDSISSEVNVTESVTFLPLSNINLWVNELDAVYKKWALSSEENYRLSMGSKFNDSIFSLEKNKEYLAKRIISLYKNSID